MGDLDEAIREHLELKRRHGAPEEEVTTKEREAMKSGALPTEPGAVPDEPAAAAPTAPPEVQTPEEALVSPADPQPADDLEPDEVLPEEALDAGLPPAEEPEDAEEVEAVLEETPEFLEDMPEQDRLWFEQRPPKDFDFDD
jgi:hypothetical protein